MTITTYRPFTVEEYHKMAEVGVLTSDERVELLGGTIRYMSPVGRKHVKIVRRLTKSLVQWFGDSNEIDIQNPVRLSDESEPEPDAMVVRSDREILEDDITTMARDVLLLVEVSDTTLVYDRNEKLMFYAEAQIPEVWIIDVNRNNITQYHTPRNGVYTHSAVYQRGDTILTTLGVEILADDILLAP